ncbi:hypothetical protein [Acaryochloris sp. CCMEE 5410]|uniref:hypothetical protein n=1 Tax=Acaryochloris sp. CCMEE 5410 TaxID=310037 RepID=UPI0021D3C457|nr:hypothetical protein [Acaryochloris sp. CCMEE 5410]
MVGSETWEQAQAYCQQLPRQLTDAHILSIPDRYPACQFGLGSAWKYTSKSVSAPVFLRFAAYCPPEALLVRRFKAMGAGISNL